MATQRRYRLELPNPPKSQEDVEAYLRDLRRLTMDEFNRLAGDFYSFRENVINSAGFTLNSVSNIAVTTTAYSATFTWTNPTQPEVTPTHVRVRIAEFGDAWAEFAYPISTWTVNALLPGTEYTFQIQLVYRGEATTSFSNAVKNCPTIVTMVESTSQIRSRTFTTADGIGPPSDGGGGDTDFPIPDTDNPGTVGGSDCWWEWKLQIADPDDGAWTDTGDDGEVDGDAGVITLDTTATGLDLDASRLYRLCIREICDSTPSGDGSYQCGEPFLGDNDWTDGCGGALSNDSIAEAPYSTADLFAIPKVCLVEGEGLQAYDDVSELQVLTGDGFDFLSYVTGEWTFTAADLTGASGYWGQVGWVSLPLVADLTNSDDFSFAFSYRVGELFPTGGVTVIDPLLGIGLRVTLSLRSNGTNYGFQVTWQREDGGAITMQSPLTLTVDNDFHEVIFTSDADGVKRLYVDAELEAADATNDEIRWDGNSGEMRIYAHSESRIYKVYGWNRALTEIEIPDGEPIEWGAFHRGASTGTYRPAAPVFPADVKEDDVAVLIVSKSGAGDWDDLTSDGWAFCGSASIDRGAIWVKVCDGTEGATSQTIGAENNNIVAIIGRFRNIIDPTDAFEALARQNSISSGDIVYPTISPAGSSVVLFTGHGATTTGTPVTPTGSPNPVLVGDSESGSLPRLIIWMVENHSGGATGTRSVAATGFANFYHGMQTAFNRL